MAKKRVSLTVEESLVDKLDSEADRKGLNRSQMVEEVVESYFQRRGIDTAVILCGGPEVKTLELHNGKPVLSHILEHLSSQGIDRAILLIGNNSEIQENFGSGYNGVALDYVEEEEPEGTAAALERVEGKIDRSFVVLNGHVIADVDLKDMLKVHEEEDSVGTMALTAVENPSDFGVAKLKGRTILGFEHKPKPGEEPSRLINAGTYVFSPEIFDRIDSDSLETVFQQLADRGELSGYIYGGEWKEV